MKYRLKSDHTKTLEATLAADQSGTKWITVVFGDFKFDVPWVFLENGGWETVPDEGSIEQAMEEIRQLRAEVEQLRLQAVGPTTEYREGPPASSGGVSEKPCPGRFAKCVVCRVPLTAANVSASRDDTCRSCYTQQWSQP